jgi:hypothetical protein
MAYTRRVYVAVTGDRDASKRIPFMMAARCTDTDTIHHCNHSEVIHERGHKPITSQAKGQTQRRTANALI